MLIRYIICKFFVPFCVFTLLIVSCETQTFLILMKFISFFLLLLALLTKYLKTETKKCPLSNPRSQRLTSIFSPKNGVCVCVCVCARAHARAQSLSHGQLFETPWAIAHQAPLSMGFFRQEYWSRLPFPSPGDLP